MNQVCLWLFWAQLCFSGSSMWNSGQQRAVREGIHAAKLRRPPKKTLVFQLTEKGLRLTPVCVCLHCRPHDLGGRKELDLLFWTVQSLRSTQSLFVFKPEAALSHLTHGHGQAGGRAQKNEANTFCVCVCVWASEKSRGRTVGHRTHTHTEGGRVGQT